MRNKILVLTVFLFSAGFCLAACPSADLTGDCFVNFKDFALMANQWLTGDPVPDDMVYIPDGNFVMGDHFDPEGSEEELPLHSVFLDSFFMSKFVITNQQYCDYLNSAYPGQIKVFTGVVYASSDDPCDYPYCDTHSYDTESQIDYNDVSGTFSVRTKGEPPRDMNDDPMVEVSWYGAASYCNWRSSEEGYEACYDPCDPNWPCDFSKHGYRLATEAEWEYAARGGNPDYRFPWGDTISHSQANYSADPCGYLYDVSPTEGFHPDYNDVVPYTAPVGSFSANSHGLYDMAGNVWEWCNDWYQSDYYTGRPNPDVNPIGPSGPLTYCVRRGGAWHNTADSCRVARRSSSEPTFRENTFGFRLVLDLN